MFSSSSDRHKAHGTPGSGIPKQDRRDQRKPPTKPVSKFSLAYDPTYRESSERGLVSRNSGDKMEEGSPQHLGSDYSETEGQYDNAITPNDMGPTTPHEGAFRKDQSKHDAPTKRGKMDTTRDYTPTPSDDSKDDEAREEQDSSDDSRESQSAGVYVNTNSPVHDNDSSQAFSFTYLKENQANQANGQSVTPVMSAVEREHTQHAQKKEHKHAHEIHLKYVEKMEESDRWFKLAMVETNEAARNTMVNMAHSSCREAMQLLRLASSGMQNPMSQLAIMAASSKQWNANPPVPTCYTQH